jgi:predicted NAD/FAD-binding protein
VFDSQVRIAVIGSGVSGLVASSLLSKRHDVHLFEREARPGGHAHTHHVRSASGVAAIDTGFMVFNERTYPQFVRLLNDLGVSSRPSDMSFSVRCRRCALQFSSRGLAGALAQPHRLVDPGHLLMLVEIPRFHRRARRFLTGGDDDEALGAWLERCGFGHRFRRHFLLPMAAAIWSAPAADIREFPARSFFRFFDNHGLLALDAAPVWRTIPGGSQVYVERLLSRSRATLHLGSPVRCLRRDADGVQVSAASGVSRFDRVVVATHADEALAMLEDPREGERRALSRFRYSRNHTVLHTDVSVLPDRPAARASWNTDIDDCRDERAAVTVTYDLSRLQGLGRDPRYCATLNPRRPLSGVLDEMSYMHPVMDREAELGRRELAALPDDRRTHYCGAHLGYGFHEDGVVSALRVVDAIERCG